MHQSTCLENYFLLPFRITNILESTNTWIDLDQMGTLAHKMFSINSVVSLISELQSLVD